MKNKFFTIRKKELIPFSILFIYIVTRFSGVNWDHGFYFHPDERAIIMTVFNLSFPRSFQEFLSPESPWNPHFFAYGSFPLYLLYTISHLLGILNPTFNSYEFIGHIARPLSAIFDTLTGITLFAMTRKFFSYKIANVAFFLYAISVLPIQLSHFYAVDSILTFFLTLSIFLTILFYKSPTIKSCILLGFTLGMSFVTKASSLIIAPLIIFVFFYVVYVNKKRFKITFLGLVLLISIAIPIVIFQPYSIIDFTEFYRQTSLQSQMAKDPFLFPYTLQFVGKIPYWYEFKNIFLWGLGPIQAIISFFGIIFLTAKAVRNYKKNIPLIIITLFFWIYVIAFGKFAVGFIRYMIPIYPLLALSGAWAIMHFFMLINNGHRKKMLLLFPSSLLVFSLLIYPLSFMHIYTQPNTRLQASEWIQQNVPAGSSIGQEHWDDGIPSFGGERYIIKTLNMYDPDTKEKWIDLNSQFRNLDYVIFASNRLYTPLQKLTDCENLPPGRCYPVTSQYYREMLNEKRGYKIVAEFTSFPTIPIINIPINDTSADENFTVFDHPKVIIFKNIEK